MNINAANREMFKDFNRQNENPDVQLLPTKPEEKTTKKVNMPVIATTIAGTVIPMLIIRKHQGKSLKTNALKGLNLFSKAKTVLKSFNIEYGLKEMIFSGAGSVLGGLSGGLLFNKNENKKHKIKESVFQLANIAIPTSIVAFLLNKSKNLKGVFPKIASVAGGIAVGMPIVAFLSNKINNTFIDKDNLSKRKICLKDYFIQIDDVIGALILAKIPFASKLHADKALPALYGLCGYEAGTKK